MFASPAELRAGVSHEVHSDMQVTSAELLSGVKTLRGRSRVSSSIATGTVTPLFLHSITSFVQVLALACGNKPVHILNRSLSAHGNMVPELSKNALVIAQL